MTAAARSVDALQAALAGEHAAVHGYGTVGARTSGDRRALAQAAYDAHRARRERLTEVVRADGADPVAAEPSYVLPFAVPDAAAAASLATSLEVSCAAVHADLVRDAGDDALRVDAARWLADAAVRAAVWSSTTSAFPGAPELAQVQPSTTPSTSASD